MENKVDRFTELAESYFCDCPSERTALIGIGYAILALSHAQLKHAIKNSKKKSSETAG